MRPSVASSWRDLRVLGLVVVMLAIVSLDLAVPSAGVLAFLCVPVLVVAGFAEQRTTGTLAILVVALAAWACWLPGRLATANGLITVAALIVSGLIAVGVAITRTAAAARREAVAGQLMESEQHFRILAENASDVVFLVDADRRISWVSPSISRTLGWAPEDVVGTDLEALLRPEQRSLIIGALGTTGGPREVEDAFAVEYRAKDGAYRWLAGTGYPVQGSSGASAGIVIGLRDVTEQHHAREELAYRAMHDPLTGLRNRAWILDMLRTDLSASARHATKVGVMFIDLDHFKQVNDSLGHAAGDTLLVQIAGRIAGTLRPSDRVGRFGGDEFIVVSSGIRNASELEAIAERIREAVREELPVQGHTLAPTASIGIALSQDGDTAESLLQDTDAALFRAKAAGRDRWVFFDSRMQENAVSRQLLEGEIRLALERREFELHFQPIVRLSDGVVLGNEVFVRWRHPERGLLWPGNFLEVAEDAGLMGELGEQVIDLVCAAIVAHPQMPGFISVNHSAAQIAQAGWSQRLLDTLKSNGIPPDRLVVEVTEHSVTGASARARTELMSLKKAGIGLHVDDFGTGSSSITLLHQLPITGFKLDASLSERIGADPHASFLTAGLAGLADGLHLMSIAEGIESEGAARTLFEQGWACAQGHLYGSPAPIVNEIRLP